MSAASIAGFLWAVAVIRLVTLVPTSAHTGIVPAETRMTTRSWDIGGPAPDGFWIFESGQRTLNTVLFASTIAGALAEKGGDLAAVSDLGTRVNAASRSFAVALTACTTPAAGKPGFDLPEDEIEVGVGIHGEPGRSREKIRPAAELAATMVEAVWSDMPLPRGAETIVMLNGLGATPLIELYLLFGDVAARLAERGVTIARSLVGNYITSLDMAGASLTVCHADQQMLDLWDSPVDTPALRWGC